MSSIGGMLAKRDAVLEADRLMRMGEAMILRGRARHGVYWDRGIGIHYNGEEKQSTMREPLTVYRDGTCYTVVMDGELYPCGSVGQSLPFFGFASHAMAVLESYLAYGYDCVNELDGAFAFAIYDRTRHELFLARDREGRKPLYYAQTGDCFYFASEPRGLLAAMGGNWRVSGERMRAQLMEKEMLTDGSTVFLDIQQLPPSHFALHSGIGTSLFAYQSTVEPYEEVWERSHLLRMAEVKPENLARDLQEALFAFGFPQFDGNMPMALAMLRRAKGKQRGVLLQPCDYFDMGYAHARADRLGAMYGIRLQSASDSLSPWQWEREGKKWERAVQTLCAPILQEPKHPVWRLLGEETRVKLQEEKSREKRMHRLSLLWQYAHWLEHYPLHVQ